MTKTARSSRGFHQIFSAIATLGIAGLLWIGNAPRTRAASYGAQVLPDTGSISTLTWVLFDRPQNGVFGYACTDFTGMAERGLSGAQTLDYLSRYKIIQVDGELRLYELNTAFFGNTPEYQGQANYFWKVPLYEGRGSNLEDEFWVTLGLRDQTGWYVANSAVSPLGRACVNGGLSAALSLLEQQYQIQFHLHEDPPVFVE